jgi:hypothetical protein
LIIDDRYDIAPRIIRFTLHSPTRSCASEEFNARTHLTERREPIACQKYRCGQEAALHLSNRIGGQPVRCVGNGTDQYGRVLAICYLGGEDLKP